MTKQEKARDARLRKRYGIGLGTYNAQLAIQLECCALCGKHKSNFKNSLHVDHNHKSGLVRGLVCFYCNHQLIRRHTKRTAALLLSYMAKYDPES